MKGASQTPLLSKTYDPSERERKNQSFSSDFYVTPRADVAIAWKWYVMRLLVMSTDAFLEIA